MGSKSQIIMWNEKIFHKSLKECNVGKDASIAKNPEANVFDFSEVKTVIYESMGDILQFLMLNTIS